MDDTIVPGVSARRLFATVATAGAAALWFALLGVTTAMADQLEHSIRLQIWADLGSRNDGLPNAVLKCPDGSLAIGLTYAKGRTVDSITLHCKVPQFAGSYFRTWTADTPLTDVAVGGTGGRDRWSLVCAEGMVIAGTHGVNKNWQPDNSALAQPIWLMSSISIECAQLTQSAPWRVAHFEHGSFGTALARGTRTNVFAEQDLDNYNSGGPFIITSDPRKSDFVHNCVDTPVAGYEVAFGYWKQFAGPWVPVIQAIKWHCF